MSTDEQAHAQRLVGRVLDDKYRLRGCIGIGGSGAVYKADQITLGRTVAVKILNEDLTRDARLVKRFQDEALAASRLNHPNTGVDHRLRADRRRPAVPGDGSTCAGRP
jgi:serine/threonine protein kinase